MSVETIENMVDWIEDNITDNPTLDDMSRYVGYSSFYCSAKFHENRNANGSGADIYNRAHD